MLMLDRAAPVAVRELSKGPCPPPTDSWRPYPHSEVVAALIVAAIIIVLLT